MAKDSEAIPYWNVNVPKEHWTSEPSEALVAADENDKAHMGIRDEDYHVLSWEEVQQVIREWQAGIVLLWL